MKPPELEYLFSYSAEIEQPQQGIGAVPFGHRMIARVTGGRVEGPRLNGEGFLILSGVLNTPFCGIDEGSNECTNFLCGLGCVAEFADHAYNGAAYNNGVSVSCDFLGLFGVGYAEADGYGHR